MLYLFCILIIYKQKKGIEQMEEINKRFKQVRTDLGLTQEEFGNRIGLSKSGISNIEHGTRKVTSKHIKLICSIFSVDELWLTTGIHSIPNLVKFEGFVKYLESLGYKITIQPESEDSYSLTVSDGKHEKKMLVDEFSNMQSEIESFISFTFNKLFEK